MWIYSDLMYFNGILMGFEWDLIGNHHLCPILCSVLVLRFWNQAGDVCELGNC